MNAFQNEREKKQLMHHQRKPLNQLMQCYTPRSRYMHSPSQGLKHLLEQKIHFLLNVRHSAFQNYNNRSLIDRLQRKDLVDWMTGLGACVLFKLGFHGRAIENHEVLISESLFKRGEKELLTNSRCSLQSKTGEGRFFWKESSLTF